MRYVAILILLAIIGVPAALAIWSTGVLVDQVLFWAALTVTVWNGFTAWTSTFGDGGFFYRCWNQSTETQTVAAKVALPFLLFAAAALAHWMNI